jgi:hypothetical protein
VILSGSGHKPETLSIESGLTSKTLRMCIEVGAEVGEVWVGSLTNDREGGERGHGMGVRRDERPTKNGQEWGQCAKMAFDCHARGQCGWLWNSANVRQCETVLLAAGLGEDRIL